VESLSAYARQFLRQMQKPDVDEISGLSPAISIDQKSRSNNPRSTVATITEIYDYLRVLYARIGHPHCPTCGREVRKLSNEEILESVLEMSKRANQGRSDKKLNERRHGCENTHFFAGRRRPQRRVLPASLRHAQQRIRARNCRRRGKIAARAHRSQKAF
jgi:hypothetical protein